MIGVQRNSGNEEGTLNNYAGTAGTKWAVPEHTVGPYVPVSCSKLLE